VLQVTQVVLAVFLISACAQGGVSSRSGPETAAGGLPGLSGMARFAPNAYVVVHDAKAYEDGPRLGLVEIDPARGLNYQVLDVSNWSHPEGRASDLEGVCFLGGSDFLVIESGYWEGKYGRLFHLRLHLAQPNEVEVVQVAKLPLLRDNTEEQEGDNFEGLACAPISDGSMLVLLGERGGSGPYPTGYLRWGHYDPNLGTLKFTERGLQGLAVSGPSPVDSGWRSITDLHISGSGDLWSSAARDVSDVGPFQSLLYRVGAVRPDAEVPVEIEGGADEVCRVDGYKVEAVSGADLPESTISLGSEDERLGGTWRALGCAP